MGVLGRLSDVIVAPLPEHRFVQARRLDLLTRTFRWLRKIRNKVLYTKAEPKDIKYKIRQPSQRYRARRGRFQSSGYEGKSCAEKGGSPPAEARHQGDACRRPSDTTDSQINQATLSAVHHRTKGSHRQKPR